MTDSERIKMLTEELTKAADSYYNTGMEIMSNYEYDAKFDELKALEKQYGITDGFTSKVGFMAKSDGLKEVRHEYEAKSLDKTKDVDKLVKTQNDASHQYVCLSWKLDGSTVQLTYDQGRLVSAVTRGNGEYGQDITQNARYIAGIPLLVNYMDKMTVRGEALMSYAEFNRLNTDGQYANARNLANATITVKNTDILKERKVEFKAFELVHFDDRDAREIPGYHDRLSFLDKLGFDTVPRERVRVSELKDKIKEWSEDDRIKALGYPVDGLVVANDDADYANALQGTGHHPNAIKGMAFKWKDETEETFLRDIQWQVGRTGVLTPVAVFDTVELEGTKVNKASLHNVSYIMNKDLRIGDKISVYKANKIIPQVEDNLSRDSMDRNPFPYMVPDKCPCCKADTKKAENDGIITLECSNRECPARDLQRYVHMFEKDGLNIEGLAENTISLLLSEGYLKTPADIFTLKDRRQELTDEGLFGEKSVDNLIKSIEKARTTDFNHFLYSQGIDGFGKGQIKVLKEYLENEIRKSGREMTVMEKFEEICVRDKTIPFRNVEPVDWTVIDGIGDVLSYNLNKWIEGQYTKYNSDCDRLLSVLSFKDEPVKMIDGASRNDNIADKTFVITGSLENFRNRDELVAEIEKLGGKVSGSVSSRTDYLINNDVNSTSGKNKKANELGVRIISEMDFLDMANITDKAEHEEEDMER